MSPEELLNDETGRNGAPCELIHPIVMGDVMYNEKQLRMGRINAPLRMCGMVNASYKAANIWDGKCPILHDNWHEEMPHRHKIRKSEKELILLIEKKNQRILNYGLHHGIE